MYQLLMTLQFLWLFFLDIPDVNLSSDSEDESCSIQMGDEEESPNQSCASSSAKQKGEAKSPNQSGLVKEKPQNGKIYHLFHIFVLPY